MSWKDMSRMWVTEMSKKQSVRNSTGALVALAFMLLIQTAVAVAPAPGTLEKWKAEGTLEKNLAILRAARAAGLDAPSANPPINPLKLAARSAMAADAIDTLNVIVILVDFSDNDHSVGDSAKFDSMLFSQAGDPISNPTGSMTDYYLENSYGKLLIQGDVTHWLRMPQTYAFYRGANYGLTGSPQLVYDACVAADSFVDFSKYDNDNNGTVDGVIVVHAGKGAEEGGDSSAIWSHRASISLSLELDGKGISDYTMNPEKFAGVMVPIGVFCHEYGHILGLPDLYDTDYEPATSDGLGSWSMMASGNYNGGAKIPAHFDPWCKLQLGFLSVAENVTTVTANLHQAPIPAVEDSPFVYRIYGKSNMREYWLIENRQKTGFDIGLPSSGLLIYHIDNMVFDYNNNYLRYKVALEQADGLNDLALTSYGADAGDPFPGSTNKREFHDMSNPSAHDNEDDDTTGVGVWNISNSGPIMYADLDYDYSRPYLTLWNADSVRFLDTVGSADEDGILEAGESADFYCRIRNFMGPAYVWSAKLTCDDPDVQLSDTGFIEQEDYLMPTLDQGVLSNAPVRVSLPADWRSRIVSFTLYVEADSLVGPGGDRRFADTFHFEAEFGTPRVLVVDDDEGFSFDTLYTRSVHGLRLPYRVWHKQDSGSPSSAELLKYRSVIWMTGDTINGGALNTLDITAITAFLNAGNNFAFASIKGPRLLYNADSTFMKNYLHARWQSSGSLIPFFKGVPGNPVGDTFAYRFTTNYYVGGLLEPLGGGEAALVVTNGVQTADNGIAAVSYSGTYRTFVMTWGAEFINDNWGGIDWATKQTFVDQILKFFGESISTGVDEPGNPPLPGSFVLDQNYPNPFNPTTQISYTLSAVGGKRQNVNLVVFNLLGQKVKTLVDAPQAAGTYVVTWDGTNQAGSRVASGIYFYRLSMGEQAVTRKMLLVK